MICNRYILVCLIFFSYIFAEEPIALIAKSIGNVKYKKFTKNKFNAEAKVNSPIFHDDGIKTGKNAFSRIMYLDSPSSISIYSKTKIFIIGEINEEVIDKRINMDEGIIKVNIVANEFGNTFILITPYSEVQCTECNFWLISNKEGDHIYNIHSNGFVRNKPLLESIEFLDNFTIISAADKELEKHYILSDEYKYLELLMINANEKYEDSYVQKVISRKKIDNQEKKASNIVEIRLRNKFNIQKTIILTYTNQ